MSLTKVLTLLALLVLAAIGLVQYQGNARLREENFGLVESLQQARSTAPPESSLPSPKPSAPAPASDTATELARLRTEAEQLKASLADAKSQRARETAAYHEAHAEQEQAEQEFKRNFEGVLQHAMAWNGALEQYLEQNHGLFPTSFSQVTPLLPEAEKTAADVMALNYEITYQGSLSNLLDPARSIVIRQKQPVQTPAKASWLMSYFYANGNSDVQFSKDGNFQAYEQQHAPKLKQSQ